MSDRELLELAAKAAGGEFSPGTTKTRTGPTWDTWEWTGPMGIVLDKIVTYPLTDDGDAFRLAVKLNLLIEYFPDFESEMSDIRYSEDPQRAARRAVVNAAAKIGESLS